VLSVVVSVLCLPLKVEESPLSVLFSCSGIHHQDTKKHQSLESFVCLVPSW
jgi:hypothetical protein